MADRYSAIAHPTRREILRLLRRGPLPAGRIGQALSVPNSTLSRHLKVLHDMKLIRSEKSGATITFFVSETVMQELVDDVIWLLKGETNEK